MFVSRTRPTVRKHCDSKYYLGDLWRFFLGGYRKSWPEVPILFQNLRSELVYTFKWTKSVARLWRNQICEWTLKKKKSPYLPTHRWNGGSGAGNEHIFKGGLVDIFLLHLTLGISKTIDLFYCAPFDPFYIKNLTTKKNHAGYFVRKLHKKILIKIGL